MALSKLLLVRVDFVQLAAHLSIAATHLSSENVSALSGGTRLTFDGAWAIPVNLGHHLHLIGVVHDKLFRVASVSGVGSLASRNNFALRSYSWNLVVVFLNW